MMLGVIIALPASFQALGQPSQRVLGIIALILTLLAPGLFIGWSILTQ